MPPYKNFPGFIVPPPFGRGNNSIYFIRKSYYPLYPLGLADCHFQEEAHISSIPSLASQPSSSRALAGSA